MAEPKLDLLLLDTHNTYSLAIGDISTYPTGLNIVSPTMQITPPSFPTVHVTFTERSVNIYNAYNLGLCAIESMSETTPLPDGVYEFKYSIHPHHKYYTTKTFIKTDIIMEKFDKAFLQTDIMNCDADMKARDMRILREINFNIQGAIASANVCANKLAMELYRKANQQIEDFVEQRCYTC